MMRPQAQPGEATLQLDEQCPAKPRPGLTLWAAPLGEPRLDAVLRRAELTMEHYGSQAGCSGAVPGALLLAERQQA
jgi:hypothetical protein